MTSLNNNNSNLSQELNQSDQLNNLDNTFGGESSNLDMVLYKGNVKLEDLTKLDLSSYEESFSWLVDDQGRPIDFNKKT